MKIQVATLPNWTFDIEEVSAGAYRVKAKHKFGASVEMTGIDSEKLTQRAKEAAEKMEQDLNQKLRKTL